MSSSVSSSVLSQLQCRVCNHQFDSETHKPIILHGSCSFCVQCLDKLKVIGKKERGFVECPLCKTRAAKSAAATNHIVLEIVIAAVQSLKDEKAHSHSNEHDEICDLCYVDGLTSVAAMHCWDCSQWMCLDHARIHSRKKDKADHGTNTITEIRNQPELLQRASLVVRFPVHYCGAKVHGSNSASSIDNKIEFYCVDCEKFICARCAGLDHSTHDKRDLSTQWQEQETSAAVSISTARSLTEQHDTCLGLLQQLVSSFDQSDDSISSQVRSAIAQIVTSTTHAIEQHNQLIDHIKQAASNKQADPIQSLDLENDSAVTELEAALDERDFVTVDTAYDALLERMNDCMKIINQLQTKLRDPACSNLGVHGERKPVVHEILKHLRDSMHKWFESITIESSSVTKSFIQSSAIEEVVEQPIEPPVADPVTPPSADESAMDDDITWQSVLLRIRDNPSDLQELIQLCDDLYYLSSDRDGFSTFLPISQWQEITLFAQSHLKDITLLPALSEALINLVIYHYGELETSHLQELLDLSMELLASHDQNSLVYSTAYRLMWALPINRCSSKELEKWAKLGITAVCHGDKGRDPDPLVNQLPHVAPTLKHLECTVPLSQVAVRGLISQMKGLGELRSFGFTLSEVKIGDDVYKELFDSFKYVPDLSRLTLSFPDCQASRLLGPYLRHCTNLVRLDLSQNTMGDVGFQPIAQSLKYTPLLAELNLSSCGIGDFAVVGQALAHVPRLRKLSLENNSGMSKTGGKVFCQSLKYVPMLRELNLNTTAMNSAACMAFAEQMHHLSLVEELYISNNPICSTSPAGFKTLCAGFARMRHLTTLQFIGIDLTASSSAVLSSHFADLKSLQQLSVAANLQADACAKFAPNLKHLSSLTALDVTHTRLSNTPATAMALIAQFNTVPQLRQLSLGGNFLGEKGCRSLASSLLSLRQLRVLDIPVTSLTDTGFKLICETFKDLPYLTSLNLTSNGLGPSACRHFCDHLLHIPLLRFLNLSDNPWGLTEIAMLCHSFVSVPQLRTLDLSQIKMGDVGLKCLVDHLHALPHLRDLILTECAIGDDGAIALANKFASLKCLTTLGLNKNVVTRVGAKVLFTELPKLLSLVTFEFAANAMTDEQVMKLQREQHQDNEQHKDCYCCKNR